MRQEACKDPKDGGKEVAKRRSTLEIMWWLFASPINHPPRPSAPSLPVVVIRIFLFYFAPDAVANERATSASLCRVLLACESRRAETKAEADANTLVCRGLI